MNPEEPPTFILRSRRVVTPDGMRDTAILVSGGTIAAVGEHMPSDLPLVDVDDAVVSPGLVDPHVHINEPGRAGWEGFTTATRAAAAGGVTTLVDMPLNSIPVTTSPEALHRKLDAAVNSLHVDCGFHAGIVPQNAASIDPLLSSGVLGVKAFLVHSGLDEFPCVTEADLREAMPRIRDSGVPLLVHAELALQTDHAPRRETQRYATFLASRPRAWENEAIALMIRLCKEFRCRVHIVHLSSSESIGQIREAKNAGLPVTVETCPHYLFFAAEEIPDGATQFKCTPPIRERENAEALWDALNEGVIDFIVSDHSPCPPQMKAGGDFMTAWGGISSLQFGLPAIWTEARKRGFGLQEVSRWMSSHPARLAGLEQKKGTIAAGFDADFVVWNPDASFVVNEHMILHRHKLTPYNGRSLTGKVLSTYLRGKKIFDNGEFSGPSGRILLKHSS